MTVITKKFFRICCLVLFITVAMGVFVRCSYKGYKTVEEIETKDSLGDYIVQLEDLDRGDIISSVSNFEELESNSELIAKVKVCNDRRLYANTIKTKIEIKEVLKDCKDKFSKNDEIYIYELVSIDDRYRILSSTAGNLLMETGEEYYVFLNSLKTAKEYKKSKEEVNTYLPSTSCYSIIPLHSKKSITLEQEKLDNGEYCYKDVIEMYVITTDKYVIDKLMKFKSKLIKKYNL